MTAAVLWDMDGVLVDTGRFHFDAWSNTLAGFGIPFDRETFRKTFGMTNPEILALLLGRPPEPELQARISDRKEQEFRLAIRGQAHPMPGVQLWLARLQASGVAQAVASSAPQENIEFLVDQLGLRAYFTALVSAFDLPGKPDPAVFLEAARQVGVAPAQCTVVEDSIVGVAAARSAGMRCIAVTTTNPPQALQAAGLVVDSLANLPLDAFSV